MMQTDLESGQTHSNQPPSRSYGFSTSNSPSGAQRNSKQPQGAQTLTKMQSSRVFVSTTALLVVAANPHRNYLLIQNNGTSDVFLGFGIVPTIDGSNALVLTPGSQYDFSSGIVPNNEIYAVAAGDNSLSINDGTML